MPQLHHFKVTVNKAKIRRELVGNTNYLVLPSWTLPKNVVMNGLLYASEDVDANIASLEGTLAPLGHPKVNGKYVSANSHEGIRDNHIGAVNKNVRREGDRIYVEKWIDEEYAANTKNGKRLLEAVEKGDPIHTSVAAYVDEIPVTNTKEYRAIAKIKMFDHDAILLDEPGAATPEQGVGLLVNADDSGAITVNIDDATQLVANAIFSKMTYRQKSDLLDSAARKKFGSEDSYAWVQDFDDKTVVIVRDQTGPEAYSYAIDKDAVTFGDTPTPVMRQETWKEKSPFVNNLLKFIGLGVNSEPSTPVTTNKTLETQDMPLTPEETAALASSIAKTLAVNNAEALKPIIDSIAAQGLQIKDIQESLTANARAEESTMREAVKAKFGEVVANSLTGPALVDMYKQTKGTTSINGEIVANNGEYVLDTAE